MCLHWFMLRNCLISILAISTDYILFLYFPIGVVLKGKVTPVLRVTYSHWRLLHYSLIYFISVFLFIAFFILHFRFVNCGWRLNILPFIMYMNWVKFTLEWNWEHWFAFAHCFNAKWNVFIYKNVLKTHLFYIYFDVLKTSLLHINFMLLCHHCLKFDDFENQMNGLIYVIIYVHIWLPVK